MNRSVNRKLKRSRKVAARRRVVKQSDEGHTLVILRSLGEFIPEELRVPLVFGDTLLTRNNATNAAINWRYQSSAFDPDPSFGSGSIPGFSLLAGFYQTYRVVGMDIDIQFSNIEAFPILFVAWPSLESNGNNSLNTSQLREYSVNANAVSGTIGPATGDGKSQRIKVSRTTEQMAGNESIQSDPNWYALTSANPTTLWYWNFGFTAGGVTVFTVAGVMTDMRLTYHIEFTRRRELLA